MFVQWVIKLVRHVTWDKNMWSKFNLIIFLLDSITFILNLNKFIDLW